jgi:hypothetical protein
MKDDFFRDLQKALKQGDEQLVETEIRKLALNENTANLNELNKAKMWLASRAILANNITLAKAMYQPFNYLLPLQHSLVLPDLSQADLEHGVAQNADWTELSLSLGYLYWRKGDFNKAKEIFAKHIDKFESKLFHTAMELYCDSLSRLGGSANMNELTRLCEPLATPEQQYRYPFLYWGSAIYVSRFTPPQLTNLFSRFFKEKTHKTDLLEKAFMLFNQAAKRPQGLVHISCGCLSAMSPNSINTDINNSQKLKIADISLDPSNNYQTFNEAIIFFACDSVYFRQFALLLVASIARLNDKALCHIHIVDPSDDSAEVLAEIRQLVPQVKINVSTEQLNLPANSPQKKPYYASARFIRAGELMDIYQQPLFIVDADMVVEISTKRLMELTQTYDVGLIVRTGSASFPWTEIQAGTAYFSKSPRSRRFLELTKQAILSKLHQPNDHQLWYIDQNALFVAYSLLLDELRICNLLSPPQEVIYSCYSRTVSRQEFTAKKLAEFGIQPLPKNKPIADKPISAEPSEMNAAMKLAESIAEARKWFEKEDDFETAKIEADKILAEWLRMRNLFAKRGFMTKK